MPFIFPVIFKQTLAPNLGPGYAYFGIWEGSPLIPGAISPGGEVKFLKKKVCMGGQGATRLAEWVGVGLAPGPEGGELGSGCHGGILQHANIRPGFLGLSPLGALTLKG